MFFSVALEERLNVDPLMYMNFAGAPVLELTLMSDFFACHFEQIHRNNFFFFANNETLLVILSVFFVEFN